MSFWKDGIPAGIQRDTAHVILIVNILAPGIGTIISAALSSELKASTVWVGVGQLLTSIIVIGYIWAIAWSVVLIKTASEMENEPLLPRREGPGDETEQTA